MKFTLACLFFVAFGPLGFLCEGLRFFRVSFDSEEVEAAGREAASLAVVGLKEPSCCAHETNNKIMKTKNK